MIQKINKSMVSRAIISKIEEERNPKEIRTNHLVGYNSPSEVSNKTNKEFTPDIAAIYEDEIIMYEIELDTNLPVEKWQTFSKHVHQNNGSFYLVVPNQLKEIVKKELEEKQVNAGVITFATE